MKRSFRELRGRCERRLADLALPCPFEVRAFCLALGARRGRPIVLSGMASGLGPCGLWIATTTHDFIFYEQHTAPIHQQHIILHEACHLLCEHAAVAASAVELTRMLLPSLQPDVVRAVLNRAAYSDDDEREAELYASMILERTARAREESVAAAPLVGPLGRLAAYLEGSVPEAAR